jgi:hypothetical protein
MIYIQKLLDRRGNQMRKAGGIIGLIAGIFGIFAAGITLMVGGIGSAVKADSAQMVVGLGWGASPHVSDRV